MDVMSPGDESDAKLMSGDMLEDIRDGGQYHPIINRIDARYKIRDHFLKIEQNGKECYHLRKKWVSFT